MTLLYRPQRRSCSPCLRLLKKPELSRLASGCMHHHAHRTISLKLIEGALVRGGSRPFMLETFAWYVGQADPNNVLELRLR